MVGHGQVADSAVLRHLPAGSAGQLSRHTHPVLQPDHAHHHQRVPSQPGCVRPAPGRTLHALHPRRYHPQGLHLRRRLVQASAVLARSATLISNLLLYWYQLSKLLSEFILLK